LIMIAISIPASIGKIRQRGTQEGTRPATLPRQASLIMPRGIVIPALTISRGNLQGGRNPKTRASTYYL